MKITVKDPVRPNILPNSYSVEVQVYGGDGDYDTDFSVDGFSPGHDDALLENLLRLLERVAVSYPNGRGGEDRYSDTVEGFEPWFADVNLEYTDEEWGFITENDAQLEELKSLGREIDEFYLRIQKALENAHGQTVRLPEWPADASLGDSFYSECTYSSHRVLYYDDKLKKHHVEVTLDD